MIDPSGALRDEGEVRSQNGVPHLVKGVELIGEYRDSGFVETPYLARRSDGQVIQLSRLLYAVAEKIDGRRGVREIADEVGRSENRQVSADNVAFLVMSKLVPLGLLDWWLFFNHGVAQSFRDLIVHPTTMLIVMGLIIVSAGFH